MKKTIGRILLMMFLLGLLNSCTTIRMPFGILDLSGDEGKAKQTATKICESINQKDAETLRGMFSENTQKNCPDLEEQVQAMFDVIGECTMTDFGCGGIENITSGVVTKKVRCTVFLSGNEEFELYFIQVVRDDTDKNNIGLTSIFLRASNIDEEKFQEWKQMSVEKGTYPPRGIMVYNDN